VQEAPAQLENWLCMKGSIERRYTSPA
jgi:hypothetical protein